MMGARAWILLCVFLAWSCGAGAVPRAELSEAPTRWAVYPATRAGSAGDLVATLVEARMPNLKFIGKRGSALLFAESAAGVRPWHQTLEQLQALPGVAAAGPLPSATDLLMARTRATARGDPTTRAAGLIVRYRGAEKRAQAKAGQRIGAQEMQALSAITGIPIVASRAMSGESFVLHFAAQVDLVEAELAAQRLQMDPAVDYASPNGILTTAAQPNDGNFGLQWNFVDPVSGINAPAAWDITTGRPDAVVAVVDTGVIAHPEFGTRLLAGYDFVSTIERGNDGDARDASGLDSGDWAPAGICGSATAAARNSSWHGSHVAGIIGAAGNNGSGIAGVNWNSRILPVRALGRCGSGLESDILDGLRWSVGLSVPGVPDNANPAWVVNMSLGGSGNCLVDRPAYQEAILEALLNRATVVVAAGNENESALTRVPASCIGTVKVAAIGPGGDKASYSNYSRAIEIAAPGGDSSRFGSQFGIYSTVSSGTTSLGTPSFSYKNGTSMATPHVAGVASLMLSVNPDLTVAQVRDILRATARPFPAASTCTRDKDCGLGIVDAAGAVRLASQFVQPFNFSDLWWVSTESGWGVNFQQQGNIMFGTWFTYAADGSPTWYFMSSLQRVSEDFFAGDIYQGTGTPFTQINGQRAIGNFQKVGEAIVAFFGFGINANPNLDFDSAMFVYDIGGVRGAKPIQRYFFGRPTICVFTNGSRAGLDNYQDLWWNPVEAGWGLNITHQGDGLFATWFTYGADRAARWLVASDMRRVPGTRSFSGRLYTTTGVPFAQINGAQASRTVTDVGELTLSFTSGDRGRMDYIVSGSAGSKQIERQVFSSPLTSCVPSS